MGFRTKLDFSDNRQVKQRIETTTVLSGATSFGVPYNQLPSGPNYTLSTVTQTLVTTSASTGTFSGNNTTTVFTWPISELYLADSTLSAITPSNSGTPQTTGYVLTADTNSLFTVDGNSGYSSYTGVGFTMFATNFYGLGGGNYSGTVQYTNVQLIQAPGLDYSGRTIWADVSGITRTEKLIITDNPQVGYVWTCLDSEGMGGWSFNGTGSTSTIWTAGTGTSSAVLGGSNGVASNSYSVSEGYQTTASGIASHAEGGGTLASGHYSHAEGLSDSSTLTIASGLGAHAEGSATLASGNFSHSQGNNTIASGESSHAGGHFTTVDGIYGFGHSTFSTIDVDSDYSAILGGSAHTISESINSGVLGGSYNRILFNSGYGWGSMIGGQNNLVVGASNYFTIIGGGNNAIADSNAGLIVTESSEVTAGMDYSVILGGTNHELTTDIYTGPANTVILGGNNSTYRNTNIFGVNNSAMIGGSYMSITGSSNMNFMSTSNLSKMLGLVSLNTIIGSDECEINGGTESVIIGSEESNLKNVYQSMLLGTYQSNITGSSTVTSAFILGGEKHRISGPTNTADYSAIINGSTNTIQSARNAIIIGGSNVRISGNSDQSVAILAKDSYIDGASVNSGLYNTELSLITNSSAASTITGGYINRILSSNYSSILGGIQNIISGSSSFYNSIIGGLNNRVFDTTLGVSIISSSNSKIYPSQYSVILGGNQNIISGLTYSTEYNTILGGSLNVISGNSLASSSILGGVNNIINTTRSAIVGGSGNTITKNTDELTTPINSGIFAGANNKIIPRFGSGSVVMSASYCAIVGGESNTISGHSHSFIGGGFNNLIECDAAYNAIVAGQNNINHAFNGVIIGGQNNTLGFSTSCPSETENSIILGGSFHKIGESSNNTWNTAIIGGTSNLIDNTVGDVNNTVILGGSNITATTSDYVYVPSLNIKTVGSSAFANDIRIDANGNLTTNTSDERLKENITPIVGALNTIKQLNGVNYQWVDRKAGGDDVKLGFIAQQVETVEPKLVFTNKVDGYKGLHVDGIIPLLVEAVKELSSGITTSNNTHLETQTILAEDNNVELNFNGTQQTAIGGGLSILHAKGQNQSADLITDNNGDFVTNNDFKPNALTIPFYTPNSSNDAAGSEGNITRDDNYMYVKTSTGWKRTNLESF